MTSLKFYIIFIFCFFVPGSLFAAPSISAITGVVADGSSITITGTSFGAKSTATPAVFEDFETDNQLCSCKTNGQPIYSDDCSHYGTWEAFYGDFAPTYSNSNNRTGSTLHSYHNITTQSDGSALSIEFAASRASTLLIDYWTYYTYVQGSDSSWQYKVLRVHNTTGRTDVNTTFQNLWWTHWIPHGKHYLYGGGSSWPDCNPGSEDCPYSDVSMPSGQWVHVTIFSKESTDNETADGEIYIWHDGTKVVDESAIAHKSSNDARQLTLFWWKGNDSGSGASITVNFDDMYIDTSWQSVWIGDDSTWANCSYREVQIPTAWSDTSATIMVNVGAIANLLDGNHYVFVIDSNGDASAGYQITGKSIALTGTLADGATEAQIVAGGETLIGAITNDTLVATFGADNAITTAFIVAIDSAQSEATGWDAEVRGDGSTKMTHAEVVRTNDTTFTVTLTAKGAYDITANDVITLEVLATSLTGASPIVATPSFTVVAAELSGAESTSVVYDATGPSVAYDAGGITVVAP